MNHTFPLYTLFFLLTVQVVHAQKKKSVASSDNKANRVSLDYKQATQLIYKNINANFYEPSTGLYTETNLIANNPNKHSWLWPLCGLIQGTNEMEVLEPEKDYMSRVAGAIDQYYSAVPPSPAYQDYVTAERLSSRFFDDNQWIAIAYLDAYHRNKKPVYLEKAKMIYQHMVKAGLDTVAGGGLYWKEGELNSKNTCSNGPGILVALQLYKVTGDKQYLELASKLYSWTNKHLQAPDGLFYDAIKIPSLKVDQTLYTYNTGSMLQSNVLLYQVTNDKKYLNEAYRIAAAGKKHFFKNGKLPGNYWFNAVMLRGYAELFQIDHNQEWIGFFKDDADRIWREERDGSNLLGTKPVKELIDQAGMLEIYARLYKLIK
ncbi:glycoside hydrolase family 76 protein [Pedobacter cryoconitis]|nr:glycoside hydrolase family 76 protein [Pedobacter cryoconitis]